MGVVAYLIFRKRISPEELEYQRRTLLAMTGRLTDGSIVGIDETTEETSMDGVFDLPEAEAQPAPHIIQYRYRIAGVVYECAQDVTALSEHVRNLRIDLPVQVRYDPRNPADSIIVAENWTGVRLEPAHDHLEPRRYD